MSFISSPIMTRPRHMTSCTASSVGSPQLRSVPPTAPILFIAKTDAALLTQYCTRNNLFIHGVLYLLSSLNLLICFLKLFVWGVFFLSYGDKKKNRFLHSADLTNGLKGSSGVVLIGRFRVDLSSRGARIQKNEWELAKERLRIEN